MALFKINDTDLKLYCGDTGNLKISNLPTDKNYNVYLQVLNSKTQAKVFEIMVQSQQANNVIFSIDAAHSDLLTVSNINTPETYYWSIKLCDSVTGTEDTVIPKTVVDPITGNATFSKPYKLIVLYKMVEGTAPTPAQENSNV